ncbi:MAG: hypothetical protein V2I32_04930 [Desulforhopalus sp.]|jgi:hypothetical protein|nr:hypothetical protein [Desulforhopalus sp.]
MRSLLCLLGLAMLLGGCSTAVLAPPPPEEPRPVFLLDHGHHSSLVLTTASDEMIRYSYGDWRFYALGDSGSWQGVRAVLQPTPAGLGRKALPGPPTKENVLRQVLVGIEQLFTLQAESAAVDTLQESLDLLYARGTDTLVYNPTFDLEFVRHPRDYTLAYNSNTAVTEWLTSLDCTVSGRPILANWQLIDKTSGLNTPP